MSRSGLKFINKYYFIWIFCCSILHNFLTTWTRKYVLNMNVLYLGIIWKQSLWEKRLRYMYICYMASINCRLIIDLTVTFTFIICSVRIFLRLSEKFHFSAGTAGFTWVATDLPEWQHIYLSAANFCWVFNIWFIQYRICWNYSVYFLPFFESRS